MTKQTELLKRISAKVRARGVKPFTKAFGRAMKAEFKKLKKSGRSNPKKSNKARSKPKSKTKKSNKTSKKKNPGNKSVAGKKGGTKGMTRLKRFLIGLGVGVTVSTVAGLARTPEIESAGPVIDALAGAGVEGQLGTALPRIIRVIAARGGLSLGGNGGNGNLALEGA